MTRAPTVASGAVIRALLIIPMWLGGGRLAFAYTPTSLTAGELACEQKTSGIVAKAWVNITKCQARCDAGAVAGKNPAGDCRYPWGGNTLACVEKAKTKTRAGITSRCANACPACYDSTGNCNAATGLDQWLANDINNNPPDVGVEIFASFLYDELTCADENTLTVAEARCRERLGVFGAKYLTAFSRCLARCRRAQASGYLPLSPDPCRPPATDQATADCYDSTRLAFARRCTAVCPDPPDCGGHVCYGGINGGNPCTTNTQCPGSFCEGPLFRDCFDWSSYFESEALYLDRIPAPFETEGQSLVFCPSPSGAFLDPEPW